MKQRKSIKVSKEKAIIIASNHNNILYIYKAYINTYTYNHQSYKAFRIGLYLRGLLFMC